MEKNGRCGLLFTNSSHRIGGIKEAIRAKKTLAGIYSSLIITSPVFANKKSTLLPKYKCFPLIALKTLAKTITPNSASQTLNAGLSIIFLLFIFLYARLIILSGNALGTVECFFRESFNIRNLSTVRGHYLRIIVRVPAFIEAQS